MTGPGLRTTGMKNQRCWGVVVDIEALIGSAWRLVEPVNTAGIMWGEGMHKARRQTFGCVDIAFLRYCKDFFY